MINDIVSCITGSDSVKKDRQMWLVYVSLGCDSDLSQR